MARYTQYFAIAVCALTGSPLHAQHHHAHIHGVAELQLLQDGEMLSIELRSPALNILGFEHPTEKTEYVQAAETARSRLSDSGAMLRLEGGNCQIAAISIDIAKPEQNNRHQNVVAHYEYRCDHPDGLLSLSTDIQGLFPSIHSLHVQWVLNHRQGATKVNHNQQRIVFK